MENTEKLTEKTEEGKKAPEVMLPEIKATSQNQTEYNSSLSKGGPNIGESGSTGNATPGVQKNSKKCKIVPSLSMKPAIETSDSIPVKIQ